MGVLNDALTLLLLLGAIGFCVGLGWPKSWSDVVVMGLLVAAIAVLLYRLKVPLPARGGSTLQKSFTDEPCSG